ncbi:hypothetical protein [Streptomyces melanogenes]|uniref:hypothetical protein n=1 Tax=Streptomyces melanogenes TaxID=67326 RepID=UPI00167DB836|nr:hypothetical protein [Streptomyces melanogenes]GGP85721.1 hypothetical protein GCM10010278_75180 [Streptomyces melanogenes]
MVSTLNQKSTSATARAPDDILMSRVRAGHPAEFRPLYHRHYPAVFAYALTCARTSLDAYELTLQAFTETLQRLIGGERPKDQLAGSLRLQLMDCLRTIAVRKCARDGEGFSSRFREWVADGAPWPLQEREQFTLAWEKSSRETRCLLWHTVLDRDEPLLASRITGIAQPSIEDTRASTLSSLRYGRMALYLGRMDILPECREAIQTLAVQPNYPAPLHHAYACESCYEAYQDIAHLDARLEAHLPGHLLGWWPALEYPVLKASVTSPPSDPPFLERAIQQARTAYDHGTKATGPLAALRTRVGLAIAGFALGATLGAVVTHALLDGHRGNGKAVTSDLIDLQQQHD